MKNAEAKKRLGKSGKRCESKKMFILIRKLHHSTEEVNIDEIDLTEVLPKKSNKK